MDRGGTAAASPLVLPAAARGGSPVFRRDAAADRLVVHPRAGSGAVVARRARRRWRSQRAEPLRRRGAGFEMSERGSIDEALLAVREGLQRRMRGILHSHRIPPQDAEDLVQTALAAMVAGWDDILEPRVWLCGTLRNCCLAYWRARRAHAARFEELDGLELDRGSESERA